MFAKSQKKYRYVTQAYSLRNANILISLRIIQYKKFKCGIALSRSDDTETTSSFGMTHDCSQKLRKK